MDAKEIEIVDIVYRSYYKAYQQNKMKGIIDVANETGLTLDEVKTSIFFLKGENQIKLDNKGFDPINSGEVYKLTDSGYSWFAKTCWVDELIIKPNTIDRGVKTIDSIYGDNNQKKHDNSKVEKVTMKIFISHASANKHYGDALVELLTGLGVLPNEIVYTSNSAYGIPIGKNIFNWLKSQITEKYFVVYLLSEEYYNSIACLNEMGAAWVVENEHAAIFLPEFDLNGKAFQSGAIDPREIGFFINDTDRLTEFCQHLKNYFSITDNLVVFGQRIQKFLAEINVSAGKLKPITDEKSVKPEIVNKAVSHKTVIEQTMSDASELKEKLIDPVMSDVTLPKLYHKFLDEIAKKKLTDSELLLLHYIIERSKVKLGTGWQTPYEIQYIREWEDMIELNHRLSDEYEQTIRKFDLRSFIEVSALTSSNNPKEVQIKADISKYILDLPDFALVAIKEAVERNKASQIPPEDDEDLPF